MTLLERFWKKVLKAGPDECWEWQAYRGKSGYGSFSFQGDSREAHRIAWILTYGTISEGLCVLHKCDNRGCVNPNHLWLGTKGANNTDREIKGRSSDKHGENNPNVKLTITDVQVIRERRAAGEILAQIAKDYQVTPSAIRHTVSKRNWKESNHSCV